MHADPESVGDAQEGVHRRVALAAFHVRKCLLRQPRILGKHTEAQLTLLPDAAEVPAEDHDVFPTLDLAVAVTSRALADRAVDPASLDGIVLGLTVPQPETFYGAPTLAARLGAVGISGPMVSQACATSVAALHAAAGAVAAGSGAHLVVAADRISNGPTLSWPAPSAPGGAPLTEHWVPQQLRPRPLGRRRDA